MQRIANWRGFLLWTILSASSKPEVTSVYLMHCMMKCFALCYGMSICYFGLQNQHAGICFSEKILIDIVISCETIAFSIFWGIGFIAMLVPNCKLSPQLASKLDG